MKKVLICSLAVILLLTFLSGCFPDLNREDNAGSPAPSAESNTPETSASVSPTGSDNAGETTPSGQAGMERGVWNGKTYESAFFDIKFTMPEGWSASTDAEIAELIGTVSEILTDEQTWMLEAAKRTTIYDMYAKDPQTGSSVLVLYEKLAPASDGTEATEEELLDQVKQQLSSVEGKKYTFEDTTNTEINGKTYLSVKCYEENSDITHFYYIRRQSEYMVGIVLSLFDDTSADTILAQFK